MLTQFCGLSSQHLLFGFNLLDYHPCQPYNACRMGETLLEPVGELLDFPVVMFITICGGSESKL